MKKKLIVVLDQDDDDNKERIMKEGIFLFDFEYKPFWMEIIIIIIIIIIVIIIRRMFSSPKWELRLTLIGRIKAV